jgi:TolB-like protein
MSPRGSKVFASRGAVCVSGSAYEHVRGRIEAEFADLGEQTLKNIAQPVRAYALSADAVAAAKIATPEPAIEVLAAPPPAPKPRGVWARWPALAAALVLLAAGALAWRAGYAPRFMAASVDDKLANAPRLSIVVLPFANLSDDKEQDYFADGITDDLTTDLSHLPDSFVIAHSTALTFKSKPVDAKEIGKELGVRYLLEGSVRRLGESVEVNAQLISTETGAHVWADRFDGDAANLANCRWSSSPASPIRSAWSWSRLRACARCASGQTIRTRPISRCAPRLSRIQATSRRWAM